MKPAKGSTTGTREKETLTCDTTVLVRENRESGSRNILKRATDLKQGEDTLTK